MFWAYTPTPLPLSFSTHTSSAVNGAQMPTAAGRRRSSGSSVSRRPQ
jgi:hypothetical protein